jgi:hypothetical protein
VVLVFLAGAVSFLIATVGVGQQQAPPGSSTNVAQAFGSIQVDSSPRGARVFLQGKDTGLTTPAKVASVPVGADLEIGLVKNGFQDWSGMVRLESCEPRRISAILLRKKKTERKGRH